MLDSVSATDAQRAQIRQIMEAARTDLKPSHESAKQLHQQTEALFAQAAVDANAAESLRQQGLVLHDQMSRRMTQAMLDVARVLTPEQRARIGERMRDRQARMEDRMKRMESMRQGLPPRR
jgi:Spy/CpxP family protein refolding chaperone